MLHRLESLIIMYSISFSACFLLCQGDYLALACLLSLLGIHCLFFGMFVLVSCDLASFSLVNRILDIRVGDYSGVRLVYCVFWITSACIGRGLFGLVVSLRCLMILL